MYQKLKEKGFIIPEVGVPESDLVKNKEAAMGFFATTWRALKSDLSYNQGLACYRSCPNPIDNLWGTPFSGAQWIQAVGTGPHVCPFSIPGYGRPRGAAPTKTPKHPSLVQSQRAFVSAARHKNS